MWTIALSGPGRVTCICCCSVSNVAGRARWQRGWMRRVWRASSPWWSRHLKPVLLHLSTELVWILSFLFFCMQSRNILSGLLVSLVFCFVLSLRFLFFVFIISSFAFFCLPLSVHFLRSLLISLVWNLLFSLCLIYLSLAGFLVYHSSQEAGVWDIPVFTVIDYGLSSFIGALLSCKITQGSFFLSWNQFIGDIYSGMTFSGFVFQRHTALSLLTG